MIPMPPNHCVNWRHIESDLSRVETSETTLEPVVVIPDMASKSASTGRESWSSPDSRYETAIATEPSSQVSATTRKPSRIPTRSFPRVAASRPQPPRAVSVPAATYGHHTSE
jgi:hypothetical protein